MNIRILGLVLALLGVARGSSDSGSPSTPTGTAEKDIAAARGGTVETAGATLSIPAGALGADTKITVNAAPAPSSMPDYATLKSSIYDFGPNGTTFSTPVELTLPMDGQPAANEKAVISWLDETTNKWMDLNTTISGSSAVAETTHFTKFVIRFKGVEAVDCSFAACGGDVVGTWTVAGVCGAFSEDSKSELTGSCPSATVDAQFDATGSVTMNADQTYETHFTTGGSVTVMFPADCLANLKVTSCEQLFGASNDNSDDSVTCTGTAAEGCSCTFNGGSKVQNETGSWSVAGTQLTTTDEGGEPNIQEFCSQGNGLKVKTNDGMVLVFKK